MGEGQRREEPRNPLGVAPYKVLLGGPAGEARKKTVGGIARRLAIRGTQLGFGGCRQGWVSAEFCRRLQNLRYWKRKGRGLLQSTGVQSGESQCKLSEIMKISP